MTSRITGYFLIILMLAGCSDKSARITGKLENPLPGTLIYFDELRDNKLVSVDSVNIASDGTFRFERDVAYPSFYLLKINQKNFLTMLVEPGDQIELKAYYDSLNYPTEVSGSKGTELMAGYNRALQKTIAKLTSLTRIYEANTGSQNLPAVIQSIDSTAQIYLNEINSYTKKYIDDNIGSLVSLVALYQQVAPGVNVLDPSKDLKYFMKVDSSLFKLYPDYEPVRSLHEQVRELVAGMKAEKGNIPGTAMGAMAPEIALPTPEGDTISLSSTRGSVVLLDFWASWCPPCRRENPNLVKAYNIYRKQGFQIFQVSLDKTKDAWIQGIKDDRLEKWIHVSDLKYWNSVVVPLYKIESIPCNYLLDRDGNIIASNLRGQQLEAKLAEVFNKKSN